MGKRFKSVVCADLLARKEVDGKTLILLSKRKNTGNDDGKYELPGGHLEMGEDIYDAVIRESKEELLVDIKREDIRIVHLMHHYTKERLNFIFEIDGNLIDPKIGEEDKCEELVWVDILNLPNNISDKMRRIINNIVNNIEYDKM